MGNYDAETAMLANKYFPDAVDLLGDPVNPRLGMPGRPKHLAPPVFRAKVRQLRDAGLALAEIAAAIGVSVPTLRLHYREELKSTARQARQKGGFPDAG